jgi:hypothetical protein
MRQLLTTLAEAISFDAGLGFPLRRVGLSFTIATIFLQSFGDSFDIRFKADVRFFAS